MKAEKTLQALTGQVEELLDVLRSHPSLQADDLRARMERVEDALASAKHAIKRAGVRARLGKYASSVDHYVTGYPRLGFLTGVLLGGALVHLAGLLRLDD